VGTLVGLNVGVCIARICVGKGDGRKMTVGVWEGRETDGSVGRGVWMTSGSYIH